jgi:lectin, mannose-binding 1
MPRNYFFGLTSASAEQPDSFEVKSFVVHRLETTGGKYAHEQVKPLPSGGAEKPPAPNDPYNDKGWYWTEEKDRLKDTDPSTFKTDRERFDDLHARTQLLNHQLDMMFHDLTSMREFQEEKHRELLQWLAPIHDYVAQTKNSQERLELVIGQIRNDVELKQFKEHLEELRGMVGQSHMSLVEHLPNVLNAGTSFSLDQENLANDFTAATAASPRMGFFVFIVIVSQVMLLGSYIVYRKRRDMQPKKYL